MNKMNYVVLLSVSLINFLALNGAASELLTFMKAVDIPNKELAQSVYLFITDEDDQDGAIDYYANTKKIGAEADLKSTPTNEADIGARFKSIMTDPGEPGTALAAKFGYPVK